MQTSKLVKTDEKTVSKINWRRTTSSILIALITGVFGFFIAWGLLEKVADKSFAYWNSLGVTPEQPRRIAGFRTYPDEDNVDIYVESTAGSIYLRRKDSKKWETANLPQDLFMYPCIESDDVKQSYFTNLPAPIVNCYKIPWTIEWITDTTYFVILEDGSIWKWHHHVGFDTLFAFLCSGSVIGLVIGWNLARIDWHRPKQASVSSTQSQIHPK